MLKRLQINPLDLRLAIMAGVLTVMAVAFHVLTGNFLTPENLYNIAQQTAVVGIIATAMALIIVARQIDLSVGSAMGVIGVLIAFLMYTHGWHWVPTCLAGLALARTSCTAAADRGPRGRAPRSMSRTACRAGARDSCPALCRAADGPSACHRGSWRSRSC